VVSHLLLSLYSSFDSGFSPVVSNSGCRLVKPNHLNLGVVCDCFLLPSYYSHLMGLERNKKYFLTTGIRAFGSSGSDGRRRRKSRKNRKI
jgi:hypothetical protein